MGSRDLVRYTQHRAKDNLRGVVQYDGSTNDTLYLRDDVREERLQSQIDRMLGRLEHEATAAEERAFPFGDLQVTVRRFDNAIIMHFPRGRHRGIVISLEPDATRALNTFTTECVEQIEQ